MLIRNSQKILSKEGLGPRIGRAIGSIDGISTNATASTTTGIASPHDSHCNYSCNPRTMSTLPIQVPCSSTSTTSFSSWIPPELALQPHQLRQQQRDFVWHAGFLQQEEVQELQADIHARMDQMKTMIQRLPPLLFDSQNAGAVNPPLSFMSSSSAVAASSSSASSSRTSLVERILQQEQVILQLCQQYKQLTGEDYADLPEPDCDESATVLRMA
jgi:hypothetical protein